MEAIWVPSVADLRQPIQYLATVFHGLPAAPGTNHLYANKSLQ